MRRSRSPTKRSKSHSNENQAKLSTPHGVLVKTDDDFYNLLSAAMEYDASFSDEGLLKFHLEEGRIYGNARRHAPGNRGSNDKEHDEFEKAVQILRGNSGASRSFLPGCPFPWPKRERPTRAITPSILSGLCSFARTNPAEDDSRHSANISSADKITVSSSDLVLFCQGLQYQALRQLKRKRRQRRFCLLGILSMGVVASSTRLSKALTNIDEGMQRIRYHRTGGICGSISPMMVQQACHVMETAVFNILYDEAFGSGGTVSLDESCQLQQRQQQEDPVLRVCNPGKYAMHLRLRNETISWEEVANERPAGHRYVDANDALSGRQETVVNRLVRQSIERLSESYTINQPLNILDIGSGLGATLYSLVPLVTPKNDPQIRRPSRRHAKKVMLQYSGFALSTAEINNARALAEQHLGDLVQENIVNASFHLRNFVGDSLPAELLKPATYNIVVAIESLSYVDQSHLQNLLRAIYNSLSKGGLVVFVDDVVLPKDPNDPDLHGKQRSEIRMQLFRSALMRPSIVRHNDWMMLFKEAGFSIIEARDLTLEYELVRDEEDENLPYAGSNVFTWSFTSLWRFFKESYERLMLRILMYSVKVVESEHISVFHMRLQSWLRMLLLQRGSFATQRGYALRKEAFRTAELGYNLYILKR